MFETKQMNDLLKPFCSVEKIFDLYQLVDPQTHEVFDYDTTNNNLIKTEGNCYDICSKSLPCENCIAKRTCNDQKQYMKIEYLDGKVLMFVSRPVKIENRLFSLELVKNITESLCVPSYYHTEKRDIEKAIMQFNELSIRDVFTGMYNKVYIKNEIDNFVQLMKETNDTLIGIAIDIDDYTQVNVTHGHGIANDVLYYIACAVKNVTSIYDGWAGRLGPDEFGLFFKNKTMKEIEDICIELHNIVSQHLFEANGKAFHMTFSYGIADLEKNDRANEYIERLYFNLRKAQSSKKSKSE